MAVLTEGGAPLPSVSRALSNPVAWQHSEVVIAPESETVDPTRGSALSAGDEMLLMPFRRPAGAETDGAGASSSSLDQPVQESDPAEAGVDDGEDDGLVEFIRLIEGLTPTTSAANGHESSRYFLGLSLGP